MTGAEIRAFRERVQMSQCLLARMLGTGHDTVSKWESGQTKPSDTYKTKLEQLMHAAPEELGARRDEVRQEQAEERRKRRRANPVKAKKPPKPPEKECTEPVKPAKPAVTKTANPCKNCPYWQHMDRVKKQNHVLRLPPGDRPRPYLRCGAYIPATQSAEPAVSGRCQGGGVGVELWAV